MAFSDQVKIDLATIVVTGDFAVTVSYTPKGGSSKDIQAIVFGVDREVTPGESGDDKINRRTIAIMTDDVNGVASPGVGDQVAISGVTYRVESIAAEGFGKAVLTLVTGAAISKHHETHRRRYE